MEDNGRSVPWGKRKLKIVPIYNKLCKTYGNASNHDNIKMTIVYNMYINRHYYKIQINWLTYPLSTYQNNTDQSIIGQLFSCLSRAISYDISDRLWLDSLFRTVTHSERVLTNLYIVEQSESHTEGIERDLCFNYRKLIGVEISTRDDYAVITSIKLIKFHIVKAYKLRKVELSLSIRSRDTLLTLRIYKGNKTKNPSYLRAVSNYLLNCLIVEISTRDDLAVSTVIMNANLLFLQHKTGYSLKIKRYRVGIHYESMYFQLKENKGGGEHKSM